jgi:hypothetical protein
VPEKIPLLYSELHQDIQDKCNEAGIEILSPVFSTLRDGKHSTMPASHLPTDLAQGSCPGYITGRPYHWAIRSRKRRGSGGQQARMEILWLSQVGGLTEGAIEPELAL